MRTHRIGFSAVCLGTALCTLTICVGTRATSVFLGQAPTTPAVAPAFHEEVIFEISPGNEYKFGLAGDKYFAWVEKEGAKRIVRLDGKQQGGVYDDVKYLELNSDESHFLFFAKRNNSWILVMDGQEQPQEFTKISVASFQPIGNSYAFCACHEKKCRLVVDGAETGAEYTDISTPVYSRDGKRLAFFGKREKKWIAVVDGKQMGPELDDFWYSHWGFNRDSSHFFVPGRIKGNWFYVIDGQQGANFEVLSHIAFSLDGKHYAYGGTLAKAGFKKQKTFGSMVLDGRTVATYEGKGMTGSWSTLGGTSETIAEGVRDLLPDFHGVSTPEFDSQGKLIYAARRDKGDVAVFVGSEAGPGFDEILSPVIFSSDSQHYAYVAKQGPNFVEVRDNVPGRSFTSSRHEASDVRWIAMNADASHLAYETVSGGMQYKAGNTRRALRSVAIDGQSGPEYDAIGINNFHFARNSQHYFYEVHGLKDDHSLVNVDGRESKLYDLVVGAQFADDAKKVIFLARDGQRLLRVTVALE